MCVYIFIYLHILIHMPILAFLPQVRRFVAPGIFERLLRAAAKRLGRPGAARQRRQRWESLGGFHKWGFPNIDKMEYLWPMIMMVHGGS